ncbi:hypothetical protein [Nocardia yamanashiensis]|uniref:hypothetical protein n=1 Tax=Nocardia yamanashiensis TaxID=209247 RepID=UPI000837A748|nr:hypothetical protein [Nocardia yamanashiensis]
MAITAASPLERPARSLEPPLGAPGAAAAGLFVAGLVISTVRAGGSPFPSPFGTAGDALVYFRDHPAAVRTGAVLQYAAAIPLALYVAAAVTRLRRYGDDFGTALATIGGVLATVFLLASGAVSWVLTVPEVTADLSTVRAVHTLAFLLGGPANVMTTGLLIAGIAIGAQARNMLGPWLIRIGLGIAFVAMLTTIALTFTGAAVLLPIARFTGMAWLIVAGFRLSRA